MYSFKAEFKSRLLSIKFQNYDILKVFNVISEYLLKVISKTLTFLTPQTSNLHSLKS